MKKYEPLWMPRGSVRAIMALLVVLSLPGVILLYSFGYDLPESVMAFVTAVVLLVVREYFGSRKEEPPVDEVDVA